MGDTYEKYKTKTNREIEVEQRFKAELPHLAPQFETIKSASKDLEVRLATSLAIAKKSAKAKTN